jgi:hypothetical protein
MGTDIEVDMIVLISAYSIEIGAPTIEMQSTLVNAVRSNGHPSIHKIADKTNFHVNVVLRLMCMKLGKWLVSLPHSDSPRQGK